MPLELAGLESASNGMLAEPGRYVKYLGEPRDGPVRHVHAPQDLVLAGDGPES